MESAKTILENKPYEFRLTFGGIPYINSLTFVNTINELNNTFKIANSCLDKNSNITLALHPPREGSFECLFAVLADSQILSIAEELLRPERIQYSRRLTKIIVDSIKLKFYNIYSEDNFKKIEDELYEVEINGNVETVDSRCLELIKSNQFNTHVENLFSNIKDDFYITEVEISDSEKGTMFKAPKSSLGIFSNFPINSNPINSRQRSIQNVNILVDSIKFRSKSKWSGIYNEQKIEFKISHKEFLDKNNNGEYSITGKSIINCELSFLEIMDEELKEFIIDPKSYEVKFVNKVDKIEQKNIKM